VRKRRRAHRGEKVNITIMQFIVTYGEQRTREPGDAAFPRLRSIPHGSETGDISGEARSVTQPCASGLSCFPQRLPLSQYYRFHQESTTSQSGRARGGAILIAWASEGYGSGWSTGKTSMTSSSRWARGSVQYLHGGRRARSTGANRSTGDTVARCITRKPNGRDIWLILLPPLPGARTGGPSSPREMDVRLVFPHRFCYHPTTP